MGDSPFRRVAIVVLVYLAGAWLLLGVAAWLRRVLALPPTFDTLLALGVVGGLGVAIVVAWRYPELGERGSSDEGVPPAPGPEER